MAALEKAGAEPLSTVYAAYTSWSLTRVGGKDLTLSEVMNFCAKIDDIHHHGSKALAAGGLSLPGTGAVTASALGTSKGGDAMELNRTEKSQGHRKAKGAYGGTKTGSKDKGIRTKDDKNKDEEKEKTGRRARRSGWQRLPVTTATNQAT